MSLRGQPLEQEVTLPDGRVVAVRVGVAEDSYIARRELDSQALDAVLAAEIQSRISAAEDYERNGRADDAARLREEARLIAGYADSAA